jgi:uncharacterized SAM-binding protein YcdF (DUF218 family)
MFSATLAWFTAPSNIIFALGLVGLTLFFSRFTHLATRFLVVGYLLFAFLGVSPVAYLLILPLEERFPHWDASRGAPDGIIVIGGAIDSYVSAMRGDVALTDAAERLTTISELARRYPTAPIVFSGGSEKPYPPEADFAARLFESFGISPERLRFETRSLTTAENAQFSKSLIDPKPTDRWLLVTSAAHMPRAVGAFRKAGFQVEAYPVDWRTGGRKDLLSFSIAPLARLSLSDVAAHEWIGLLFYWLNNKTSELFPGP